MMSSIASGGFWLSSIDCVGSGHWMSPLRHVGFGCVTALVVTPLVPGMWLRFVCKNAGGAGWCAAAHLASLSAANSAAEKAEFSASSQYTRTLLARRGRVASPCGDREH